LKKLLAMEQNNKTILAKPSGITLEAHVSNVITEAKKVEQVHPFIFRKYQDRLEKSLSARLEKAIEYHDLGKKHPKWQTACHKDYEAFKAWQKKNGGTFKDYEKANKEEAGKNLRKTGIRHELYSLNEIIHTSPPLALNAAIAAHHSKLSERAAKRWEEEKLHSLWKKFKIESASIWEQFSFPLALKKQYEVAGPRSLLQFTDRRASAIEADDYVPELSSFHYKFPYNSKWGVQQLIEKHWQDEFLVVRAPTGAGKTDASLLWAQLQIENIRADRLIIAMPTRFTSNALSISVAESLSETGLYHSSAWFNKFQKKVKNKEIDYSKAKKEHEFARLLQTPITVCTIDHLLTALTLVREDHHQISFNLANACLVIDEADFYDDFTQANILVLLEALKEWKVPVLMMSASLPERVLNDYQKIGYTVKSIIEDSSDSERERFEIESIQEYETVEELELLLEDCIEAGAAIIYANTVDRALMFYDYFKDRGIKTVVYHSRFTEPDKQKKEELLINMLGKDAWKKKKANGIAILTQIGEMSINISADIMVSELCPIDRLTQRAGRLCRFDKEKIGQLHVIIPFKDDAVYPAPYGEFDKKDKIWIPLDAFNKTEEVLELKKYNPKLLVDLINRIYSESQSYSPKAIDNSQKLKDSFRINWLINPMQKMQQDDTDSNMWKSRNIPSQDTVFVKKPESPFFKNYLEFQAWKLGCSLEVPIYLIDKYKKENILDMMTIYIGDDEEKIRIIRDEFYDFHIGVSLPSKEQFC
jgi:CRISPR-associated endonuclease/helicase Cas3